MLRAEKLFFCFARSLIGPSRRNLTAIKYNAANTYVTEESGPFLHSNCRKKRVDRNNVSH